MLGNVYFFGGKKYCTARGIKSVKKKTKLLAWLLTLLLIDKVSRLLPLSLKKGCSKGSVFKYSDKVKSEHQWITQITHVQIGNRI